MKLVLFWNTHFETYLHYYMFNRFNFRQKSWQFMVPILTYVEWVIWIIWEPVSNHLEIKFITTNILRLKIILFDGQVKIEIEVLTRSIIDRWKCFPKIITGRLWHYLFIYSRSLFSAYPGMVEETWKLQSPWCFAPLKLRKMLSQIDQVTEYNSKFTTLNLWCNVCTYV